jgi:hypothetical protein
MNTSRNAAAVLAKWIRGGTAQLRAYHAHLTLAPSAEATSALESIDAVADALEEQAKGARTTAERAVLHLVRRAQLDPRFRYHVCPMTETFALITEAAAEITGQELGELRRAVAAAAPEAPRCRECSHCQGAAHA